MTTFVLVHGASSDHRYWSRVAPWITAAGHVVVTPDLPIGDETAGWDEYTDAVVAAVGERPDPVVLVGQSMGAFTVPLVARRVPTTLLVLLAPMIPAPRETAGAWWDATRHRAAVGALAVELGLDPARLDPVHDPRTTFFHDLPTDLVAELEAAGPPLQAATIFSVPYPLPRWPDVPTRVVAARDDRLFPLPFVRRLASERLGVEAEVVPGGHLAALGRPREVATTLLRLAGEVGHG
ncbi:alpha/beta fold hydrolase [Actinomycetospora sp. TBRC 11914]|uniref:alpha/beta fold hydrolase n=1 Tax=Actinomycetospora sp. TBRC 11914 TaxID=2729387 RepID=UPI00145E0E85|nr:alpha/beta fold hydrolase [Actinomycetospora sp. TBRC 11914]NMO93261.1 alpha/beta hydrolase [Actinomycetospora sp. TBRC 11914]